MPDAQWESLSPEQRLKYLSNSGGPTGTFVNSMQTSAAEHPAWGQTNYFDRVLNAMGTGSGKIPQASLPDAGSMIGMMSGDAGADIAGAKTAAGPNPLDDYVPTATKASDPNWGAKQEQRYQDYQTAVGQNLGATTGLPGGYDPASGGKEQRAIQGGLTPDQIARSPAWLKQIQAFHGGGA
jgi:hypothetical protein